MAEGAVESKRGLLERRDEGAVVCAEGYLFEMERRGYLSAGAYVPEVSLENPEVLAQLHRDFLHAGSDIVEAFTYYATCEKMRLIGREKDLEALNRAALRIANAVAEDWAGERPLVAGNICNTNVFDAEDPESKKRVRAMFEEMCGWAVDEGVDMMIAETIFCQEEAEIALDVMQQTGLPTVVTLGLMGEGVMLDGGTVEEACRALADQGADVVGMNCFRGPATMLPHLKRIRAAVSCHVAALPVPYRTTDDHPTFFNIEDPGCSCPVPDDRAFPTALDPLYVNRYEMAEFARQAYAADIRYLGVCCGASPAHIRAVAEAVGKRPPASRYTPDMAKHILFGTDDSLAAHVTGYRDKA